MLKNIAKIGLSAVAVSSKAAVEPEVSSSKSKSNPLKCRPSELPLYTLDNNHDHKLEQPGHKKSETAFESGVRATRVQVMEVVNTLTAQKSLVEAYYNDIKDQTKSARDYLNEKDNTIPRVGAIAVGGMAGAIFGIRRGFFRKLIYMSIGSGTMASICYPREAEMYAQHGLVEAKKYAKIGYNFVYGVKPGDEKPFNLPKIPTNFSEVKETLSDFAKSAYDSVFPDKK